MFRFSAVCFFIYASFRVLGQMQVLFEPFCPVDTILLFTVFTVFICVDE